MTSDLEDQAWEILTKYVGHLHPITSATLSRMLGIGDDQRGTRVTRALIQELVRRGLPIGATDEGYFVLESQLELEQYVRERNDRAQAILTGSEYVKRAFQEYYAGTRERDHPPPIHWVPTDEERV
jgi:hypothetical protein